MKVEQPVRETIGNQVKLKQMHPIKYQHPTEIS